MLTREILKSLIMKHGLRRFSPISCPRHTGVAIHPLPFSRSVTFLLLKPGSSLDHQEDWAYINFATGYKVLHGL